MASFFQPPAEGDPALTNCSTSGFDIYCNEIVGADRRFKYWYQILLVGVAAAGLFLPILAWAIERILNLLFSRPKAQPTPLNKPGDKGEDLPGLPLNDPLPKSITSFCLTKSDDEVRDAIKVHDLALIEWTGGNRSDSAAWRNHTKARGDNRSVMPLVNLDSIFPPKSSEKSVASGALHLATIHLDSGASCLALRISKTSVPQIVDQLTRELLRLNVPVVLISAFNFPQLKTIPFGNIMGVILESALILPTGLRRDYFSAHPMRTVVTKCAKERERRPGFFFGFLDLWDERPSAAVVKRAEKVAKHFGAVFSHRSARAICAGEPSPPAPWATIGGFEQLRRPETTDIHSAWCLEEMPVAVNETVTNVLALPTTELAEVFPQIDELLGSAELTPGLAAIASEKPPRIFPPSYVDLAPRRTNIWTMTSAMEELSLHGCYPLTSSPSKLDYAAVVDEQVHLKTLRLLQPVKGNEIHRIIQQLGGLVQQQGSKRNHLVDSLVEGLSQLRINVYKGLDSGFGTPSGDGYFWGVSRARARRGADADLVDIFISLKAPNDATTILHTWLAHHGVNRAERYALEMKLERDCEENPALRMPSSITTSLERATNAELLFFLEQLRVSQFSHDFRKPMIEFCRHLLIDEATNGQWRRLHSLSTLAGSVDIKDVLQTRLESFARAGATRLPLLENLLRLGEQMDSLIADALYHGDRRSLTIISDALAQVYSTASNENGSYADISADFFALLFFIALRRSALEDIYLESTDRCPYFLTQTDQAAVFSELWVLGSQCEIYFGILPRDLGEIVYKMYKDHLDLNPPPAIPPKGPNESVLTMYWVTSSGTDQDGKLPAGSYAAPVMTDGKLGHWKKRVQNFGALSIFCFPAIMDVVLLTFLGRGLFTTAFMESSHVVASGYAVLVALLLAAGITGWVGSVGHYYMPHYAYDNMVYFHVQRLSGGFMLSFVVAIIGLAAFTARDGIYVGLIFAAYLIIVSTYLTLLGIMATMHQRGSPLSSGRIILWRTIPVLLLAPLISSFVNGHDLKIYLPCSFAFLILVLVQYRNICMEWSSWMDNIPDITEGDITAWYTSRYSKSGALISDSESIASGSPMPDNVVMQAEFRKVVQSHIDSRFRFGDKNVDPVAARMAKAIPYINWLLLKDFPKGGQPVDFGSEWLNSLAEAKERQKQLCRGLKEHNALLLFRASRYDIGQNVALFLIALMDRWTALVMSGRHPQISLYSDYRARYGLCLCIMYFCFSVMSLDAVLQQYWPERFKLSDEKLKDYDHAKQVTRDWEKRRFRIYTTALYQLVTKLMFTLGCTTILLWLMVENYETMIVYTLYVLGYSCVVLFQFNRCFAKYVRAHVTTLYVSAILGLAVGCTLHGIPWTSTVLYVDILAMNTAALSAALVTTIWVWIGFKASDAPTADAMSPTSGEAGVWKQPLISGLNRRSRGPSALSSWKALEPKKTNLDPSAAATSVISQTLKGAAEYPGDSTPSWQIDILQHAYKLWSSHNIVVSFVDRENFSNSGFRGCCSASRRDPRGRLEVMIGMFGAAELRMASWASIQGRVASEAILYHVARTWRGVGHKEAVRVEHLILEEGETMSRRISFEIATLDPTSSRNLHLKTNAEIMRHLTLGVDVDSQWDVMPTSAREAVLCRIMGELTPTPPDFLQWMAQNKIDWEGSDFNLRLCLAISHESQLTLGTLAYLSGDSQRISSPVEPELMCIPVDEAGAPANFLARIGGLMRRVALGTVRWIAVICGADSNVERELWYKLRNSFLRGFLLTITLAIWKVCHITRNAWVYAILIYHRPALASIARLARKGAARSIRGNTIVVELSRKAITGFASENEEGMMMLDIFDGILSEAPEGKDSTWTALYDSKFRLQSRVGKDAQGDIVDCVYRYNDADSRLRWPTMKTETGASRVMTGYYDKYGRICVGTLKIESTEFSFRFYYKATPKGSSDILRADYEVVGSETNDGIYAYWGEPIRSSTKEYNWVPSERLCRVVRKVGGKTYTTTLEYQHRRDPTSVTVLETDSGTTAVAEPPSICPSESILLKRPKDAVFHSDDLLIYHGMFQLKRMRKAARAAKSASGTPVVSSLSLTSLFSWHGRVVYSRVPTWRIRTELWNHWLKTGSLDAITACWMDEDILRNEPLLKEYWKLRDRGRLTKALAVLESNINQIFAAIEIETAVSEVCLLPIKTSDLYAMGLGNDATQVTTRPQDCYKDTKDRISVIFTDIGCWPNAPGGVSNCRRDLVNGHSTIRNHVLAESANEFGIPRFQIEKNVQSLQLLPLWGLDGRSAHHGIIDNLLQSEVDEKIEATDYRRDVEETFVPLLKAYVKGARTIRCSREDLITYSNAILSISKYFEFKDYNRTWESPEVEKAWVEAWMTDYHDKDIKNVSDYFAIEQPSLSDFQEALGIFKAYFFVFSVNAPEECPRVFQSTHHGIGSLFGMILKYRRGTTFCIWDHAILWRECCLNISPAQCALPIPVQSMVLAGIGLATRLAYLHADVIMPCTSLYNPMWETEIGTDRGRIGSRKRFSRKIEPIVNGISNMESFQPIAETRTKSPTVVMLSHVQFIKGIKSAIQAADVLVNTYGFKDYQLHIYGSKDRQPSYCAEMTRLISECKLSENVFLKGFGKPNEVLKDAWLFMNSSISEGLPLAIGEAALAGVPIVATEVGATALVLTEPDEENTRYGEVVPPNDPTALARAQLRLLSMIGPWTKYTDDIEPVTLPEDIGKAEMEWLSARMREKTPFRKQLGMLSRGVVMKCFHGERYLREHEQMYWVQWHLAKMRERPELNFPSTAFKYGGQKEMKYIEGPRATAATASHSSSSEDATSEDGDEKAPPLRWQEFNLPAPTPPEQKSGRKRLSKSRPGSAGSGTDRDSLWGRISRSKPVPPGVVWNTGEGRVSRAWSETA
ncbi:uncharacterized protein DNG_04082 [Cephalotrichum gorgonifer]|uniref:DUF3492 domain-containing protein n=1 Tax=Cephalotrichum gorgonifer TaxID=2041049 RepID=A0AAE8SU71_9PEZI|nr:uncharacterized protein DNG_04082 [Cephalotrichum gorgonifer]